MSKGAWGAVISSALSACACATISSAERAVPIDERGQRSNSNVTASGLRVSGEELSELSSQYFGALELTFENDSATWVHVERVHLDFGGAANNRTVLVPWGEDIRSWYTATAQRNQIRETNRELAFGVVGLTGLAVAHLGTGDAQKVAGGLVAVGALTSLAVDAEQKAVQSAERVRIFPDDHLLSGPFGVPPALFAKKWIVLNTQDSANAPCVDRVLITYELRGRPYERVLLKFKRATEWQRRQCAS